MDERNILHFTGRETNLMTNGPLSSLSPPLSRQKEWLRLLVTPSFWSSSVSFGSSGKQTRWVDADLAFGEGEPAPRVGTHQQTLLKGESKENPLCHASSSFANARSSSVDLFLPEVQGPISASGPFLRQGE